MEAWLLLLHGYFIGITFSRYIPLSIRYMIKFFSILATMSMDELIEEIWTLRLDVFEFCSNGGWFVCSHVRFHELQLVVGIFCLSSLSFTMFLYKWKLNNIWCYMLLFYLLLWGDLSGRGIMLKFSKEKLLLTLNDL